ncbi:MAG TPA: hypothetical protein ENK85_05925 [Saprospiraceae bacterium]|nr:hypothetical protein [Saprospiraceae bacterium]
MSDTKKVMLADLHDEHKKWTSQLAFCKDEVDVFESRLSDLVQRFTAQKVLAEIERFQNQFIRQKEVIDILKHKIGEKHRSLELFSRKNPRLTELPVHNDQDGLREEMADFLRIYKSLKKDYNKLLLKLL